MTIPILNKMDISYKENVILIEKLNEDMNEIEYITERLKKNKFSMIKYNTSITPSS